MSGYVYILKSDKNFRYYIGSTNDLDKRIIEHNSGKSTYTSFTAPFTLIFSQQYDSLSTAKRIEYWLKRQKSKKLINRIILEGRIDKIL